MGDSLSPLGSPIVLQRKGSVYGANVPMITELVNDSNVQFLDQVHKLLEKNLPENDFYLGFVCVHKGFLAKMPRQCSVIHT